MKHKLAIFISFLFVFLLSAMPIRAEMVYFRVESERCCEFSLTETFDKTTSGKVGPGCDFSVDLYPHGEWETTGGYFDSPSYGWGGDSYGHGERKCDNTNYQYSFTCDQPNYSFDSSSLPSFVTKIGESDLNPQGGGATNPKGKRYQFRMSSSAPSSGSFNLAFSFTSNCQMKKGDGTVVEPVDASKPGCHTPNSTTGKCKHTDKCPVKNINPRKGSASVTFQISDSCGPTPTKVPCNAPCTRPEECVLHCPQCTADSSGTNVCKALCDQPCTSPNDCPLNCPLCLPGPSGGNICLAPTSTPVPTSTPIPTSTPVPTKVPCNAPCTRPEECVLHCPQCTTGSSGTNVCKALCDQPCTSPNDCPLSCSDCTQKPGGTGNVCRPSCNCDSIEYSGTLAKGEKVTFKAYAKVENPDTNNAKVLNMVYHVEKNGTEIATSSEIAAVGPVQVTPAPQGPMFERYQTSWDWTIPAEGSGEVEYRVWVEINCGYKTAQATRVLAASTKKNPSFFDLLFSFFGGLFGVTTEAPAPTPTPTPTSPPAQPTVTPDVTLLVPTAKSLQLGTFIPPTPVPRVEKGCTWIKFWIVY